MKYNTASNNRKITNKHRDIETFAFRKIETRSQTEEYSMCLPRNCERFVNTTSEIKKRNRADENFAEIISAISIIADDNRKAALKTASTCPF